jgi:hypothetical protein
MARQTVVRREKTKEVYEMYVYLRSEPRRDNPHMIEAIDTISQKYI